MRVRDVAKRLEISNATVYAMIATGKLQCHRIGLGRGVIRISEEQLQEYLAGSQPKANSQPSAAPRRVSLKHLHLP
jgi:excisionase family DNA binding protein